jgi:hypothetical protein
MAANNNLYRYGQQNIKEMEAVGSNQSANIFVQIDQFGRKEVSRYKIEKNRARHLATISRPPESVSGTPESLLDFIKYIVKNYPNRKLAIILWNHGSGAKEPALWRGMKPHLRDDYFFFNQKTKMFEINKNLFSVEEMFRGIGFNDVAHTYITNAELKITLERISKGLLNGKKIDLLGFDACHMAMVEIGTELKTSVDYMIGSEELEPGAGWDYKRILKIFQGKPPTSQELAKRIVTAYKEKYNNLFADLTLSAIKLENFTSLEKNIDKIAAMLAALINSTKNNAMLNALTKIRRNPLYTTAFLDSDYIDIVQFYKSLAKIFTENEKEICRTEQEKKIAPALKNTISAGLAIMQDCIIQNYAGRNAKNAFGLAIYFPTKSFHSSYLGNEFAKETSWSNLIYTYLNKLQKRYLRFVEKAK